MAMAVSRASRATTPPPPMGDAEFARWVRLLEARTGVTVPLERKPFLVTGLRRRMRETGHSDYNSYYEDLLDGVGSTG